MIKLLLATRNEHKVTEIRSLLGTGFECVSLRQFPGAPVVVENADTFEGNARKKAENLAAWQQGMDAAAIDYVLADDSGLEVDALNGAPGVHSARFATSEDPNATGNADDSDNNAKLLRLLGELPLEERTARFRCVLALTDIKRKQTQFFEGACEGRMAFEARGQYGFGYDPLFIPTGMDRSFAELGEETKNQISHRSNALRQLKLALAATD